MEINLGLQIRISIHEDKKISRASIVEAIEGQELEKNTLKLLLEEIDRHEVNQLCGKKYSRENKDKPCKRKGRSCENYFTKNLGSR